METKTQDERNSEKDTIGIAIAISIGIIAFTFCFDFIDWFVRYLTITLVGFSLAIGSIGRQRKIGFGPSFYISLFASPILGIIFTLISPRVKDEEYKEKMLEMAAKSASKKPAYVADELRKLNELRKEGALTEDEFHAQKEKLLGP